MPLHVNQRGTPWTQLPHWLPPPVAIVLASLTLGACLVVDPIGTTLVAGALSCVVVALLWPRVMMFSYVVFVIVQDLLVNFASDLPRWILVLKRADELVLLILLAVTLSRHSQAAFRPVRAVFLAFAVTVLIGIVSTVTYGGEFLLAGYDAFLLYKGIAVFYIVSQLKIDERDVEFALRFLIWAGVACLAVGLVDFALGDSFRNLINHPRPVEYRRGIPTIVSIFSHPGTAGWFMAFCTCVAFAFWIVRRTPIHLVLTLAFASGSLLSLRRKPLIGLAAVFILALFMTGRRRSTARTVIAATLLIACFLFVAGDIIVGIFEDMFSLYLYSPNPMNRARNAMHVASVQVAADHFPLGAGYGRFGGWIAAMHYSPLYYEYGLSQIPGLMESRPSYLQDAFWPHVIGELGFIGAIFFLLALFYMVRPFIRGIPQSTSAYAVCGYAALFVFTEAIPESFASVIFEKTIAAALIFGLLAIAWGRQTHPDGES